MRGWKPINFNQFSWNCNDRMYGFSGDYERAFCHALDSKLAISCCAAFCPEWRKLGRRADIKVVKVTANNSAKPKPRKQSKGA